MSQTIDLDTNAVIFRPVLTRAGLAAAFGIASFLFQDPSAAVVNYGAAIFFLFSGSAMWEYLRRDPVPEAMRTPLSIIAAVYMLGALTLVGVQIGGVASTATWIVLAATFGLSGLAELWAFRWRKTFTPARDHLIAGIVAIIVAGLLVVMPDLDYRLMFGISGTYGLVAAVLFGITGIGYYLDVRKAVKEDGYEPPAA